MIHIYTVPSSTGSRRAMEWMKERNIPFTEQRLDQTPLTLTQLKDILLLTDDGTDSVVSTRSKAYKEITAEGIDVDELTISQLHMLIAENPRMLRYPIVKSPHKLMVGFDLDRIRVFLPRSYRLATYARHLDEIRSEEDTFLGRFEPELAEAGAF